MKTFALAGVAIAALAALPALAQPGPAREGFGQPLTRAAVQTQVQARFAKLDANRDGFVTQDEAKAVAEARRTERQASRGERRAALFERLDANRDGSISRAEFDSRPALGRGDRAERRGERGERRAGRMEHRGHRMGRGGAGMAGGGFGLRAFETMDANRDGRVSLAEASTQALSRFDRADANRDGTITREERQAVRAERGERRGS
jgi:Ca2+-binding EF-hand superfamily protein